MEWCYGIIWCDHITELYYRIILWENITEFNYITGSRNCLGNYVTELCYGLILRNYIMGSYYRIILRNDITQLYSGIIFRKKIPGMPGTSPEPLGILGIAWARSWDPWGRPWDPWARPWDSLGTSLRPRARPWDFPGTPRRPPGTH